MDQARRRAADKLGKLPIEIVSIVLQERRTAYATRGSLSGGMIRQVVELWKRIHPHGGGVRHFYLRGVEFALQRFVDHVAGIRCELAEPSRLVLDDLNWARNQGRKTKQLMGKLAELPEADTWVIRNWMERGLNAAYDAYARWYASGFSPPYDGLGALGGLGFESSFYQCTDERSDAMQVADFVAGATGAFVTEVARRKPGVARECVRAFRRCFRASGTRFGGGMWGNGFVLWPPKSNLWKHVK